MDSDDILYSVSIIVLALLIGVMCFAVLSSVAEHNAEFFCEAQGLVLDDFEHNSGELTMVDCEIPSENRFVFVNEGGL